MKKNIRLELENYVSKNTGNTKLLAKYLLEYQGDLRVLKIRDLVDLTYVSTATATRLAQKLGFSGFNELKIVLATENGISSSEIQNYNNSTLEKYLIEVNSSMFHTVNNLNYEMIIELCKKIIKSNYIYIFATGGTLLSCQDFSNKIKRIKLNSHLEADTHNQYFNAKNSDMNDICIGISYSGTTQEVINSLNTARLNNCVTCLITSNSEIGQDEYDYVIYLSPSESLTRNISITSRTSILAVLDIIYLEILNTNFDNYQKILENNHYKRD